jgi:hypothetical protein
VKVGNNGCFRDLRAIGLAETRFFPKYFVTDRKNRKKPGFFGLDASRTIGFKADRPYRLKDVATLALMTEFYRHLRSQPIKAEALRKAQLAMIHKHIIVKDGQLRGTESAIDLTQSPQVANSDFSHPKFWAGFTIIGSPW